MNRGCGLLGCRNWRPLYKTKLKRKLTRHYATDSTGSFHIGLIRWVAVFGKHARMVFNDSQPLLKQWNGNDPWLWSSRSVLENMRQVKFPHNSLMMSNHCSVLQHTGEPSLGYTVCTTQATYQVEEVITKAVLLCGGF